MDNRSFRALAVVSVAALLLGALVAAPADAKKKKKKAKKCPAYTAPEWAGEAETTVVTDKATAEAPVEVTVPTDPGLGFTSAGEPGGTTGAASFAYHNVQVDSNKPTANLFARIEYLPAWDYDLFLRTVDGTAVAYEADFNPATGGGPTPVGGNEGGHPEPGAGQIDGYSSLDCAGFTLEIASATSPGGDVALTLWLEQ